ncbi:hypothetical protein CASFOL_039900 [Castilleja foliolosa]|uniref:Uncharacterized protein n=1 Tax=Castilleja foliolosa TaxID=1961234 RepID=A0ABD3BIA9_9LAMI
MAPIMSSLVMVLLCISSHLYKCNARSFGVLHKDVEEKTRPLFTKDNDEKLHPSRVSTQPEEKSSMPNGTKDAKEKNINEKEKMMINSDPSILDESAKVLDTTKGDSRSYVSWRVPHKKRGEQEPGFNLDYLPPKTHPPEHN